MLTRAIAIPLALLLSIALAGCMTSSESEPEDATVEAPAVAEPVPAENDVPGALDTDPQAETEAESSLPAADAPEDAVAVPAEPPPIANEIELPPGFAAFRWQEELSQPTALAFSPDGRLFVAERGGKLWSFRDLDGNGAADERVLFADGLTELLGFAILDDARVYVSDRGRISLAEDLDGDGTADIVTPLIRALPSGRHQNNGIALGPDGRLYLTLGSTCNECVEDNGVSASILALDLDSLQLEVYASGLRNSYDLVFTPDGSLWATDNGSDPPCATPDELNRITSATHYGWPYCEEEVPPFENVQEPALELGLHTSADGLVWVDSPLLPPELSGGFYIALFGANSGDPEIGKRVQFAKLEADGSLTLREFATGFGNPLDVTVGPGANLYVADFSRGVIYRIGAPPE